MFSGWQQRPECLVGGSTGLNVKGGLEFSEVGVTTGLNVLWVAAEAESWVAG